jgi:hypothetical protein
MKAILHFLCPWCRRLSVRESLQNDLYLAQMDFLDAAHKAEAWNAQVIMLKGRIYRLQAALNAED